MRVHTSSGGVLRKETGILGHEEGMSLGGIPGQQVKPHHFPILWLILYPLSAHTVLIFLVSPSITYSYPLPYPHLCPELLPLQKPLF